MKRRLMTLVLVVATHIGHAAAAEPAVNTPHSAQPLTPKTAGGLSPQFQDLSGKKHAPLDIGKKKAAVVIFVLHDCPISNKYAPEIQRLASEFAPKEIGFFVIHVDPELDSDDARKHAKEYGYKLPVLIDRKHELVHRLKATTAPEAFVVGPEAKVLYRGRIDDRYVGVGKARQQVQRQDLRLALNAVVDGKPVEVPQTKAIGCYIPELE